MLPPSTFSDICPSVQLDLFFQGHRAMSSPLTLTIILKRRLYYIVYVLQIHKLSLREMKSSLYVTKLESERSGTGMQVSGTGLFMVHKDYCHALVCAYLLYIKLPPNFLELRLYAIPVTLNTSCREIFWHLWLVSSFLKMCLPSLLIRSAPEGLISIQK